MIHTSRKVRWTVILISLWTFTQTIIHLCWVLYAYLLTLCWIKPTYYDVVFVYLTYLYKRSCGSLHVKKETLFLDKTAPEDERFPNETASKDVLYKFINDTINSAVLPLQSSVVGRTELYLALLFIADLVWSVTAICLFVGVFCKVRQKFVSIIFYGPWLMCSGFVNFLDAVSSVQYGIDLVYIRSYTSWLKFVGVTNYDDFKSYDEHPSATVVPILPTTVVVALLSRVFVVWLLNVISFFVILFLAIPELFPRAILPSRRGPGETKLTLASGEEVDLNSTEARIRNWQLFYGAIEASNSTMASSSPGTSTATSTDNMDHNSNSKSRRVMLADDPDDSGHDNEKTDLDQKSVDDSGFRRFSDVANGVSLVNAQNINIPALKGHVPWSYINPEGQYVRKHESVNTRAVREDRQSDAHWTRL